jgi:cellobiose-specific phosphotransferase system component IIC
LPGRAIRFFNIDYLGKLFMAEIKTNTQSFGNMPLQALACALLTSILVAFGLHAVFIAGPALRAAAHEQLVQAIADEDRQVCETLGMRSGTDAFAACSRELSLVRQKQVNRDNAAAQGIL